jgi:hypothetical protein
MRFNNPSLISDTRTERAYPSQLPWDCAFKKAENDKRSMKDMLSESSPNKDYSE